MKQNFDICYVIAHGFAARMLLQTGLILQLVEHGKRIAIIAPDAEDENLKMLEKQGQISVFEASVDTNIWDDDYLFKRKYFLENIKANPALWEKHIQAIRYNTSKHPWRRIRPFLYYLIYFFNQYFPSIGKRFAAKENQYLASKDMTKLMREINPKLVISTYPVSILEAKVLYAAKQKKIPTTIHLLSWDNISCKGKFPILADNFITWGNIMSNELKEYYGISDDRIYPCGVPHFDHHIVVKKQPKNRELLTGLGLTSDLPYIFVAMSSPYFAPKEIDIVEWLAKAIRADVFGEKMQLVVRPHPQNVSGFLADKSWLGRLKNIQNNRVAVDFPKLVKSKMRWSMQQNDMNHLSNLLVGSSVVLNSGSTVAIDALMVEKPVIFTSFDGDAQLSYWKSARRLIDYNHLAKFIKIGGGTPVFSYEELAGKIKEYIANPQQDLAERNHALMEQCFNNDGKSTGRVVEAVLEILSKTQPT